jgi:hypothetical protein
MERADIMVFDANWQLQLVGEVKNKYRASAEWVTRMRYNLLFHTYVPNAPYFLLALPDYFHLWVDALADEEVAPDFTIPATEILSPYVNGAGYLLSDVTELSLEILVNLWLEDLIHSEIKPETARPTLQWLFDSNLYPSIKNGKILREEATV